MSADTQTVFYSIRVSELEEGMSTADGQDIIEVNEFANGDILARVYTPRSDDAAIDAENRAAPESRFYRADERVELAVFPDTEVDGSERPSAVVSGN